MIKNNSRRVFLKNLALSGLGFFAAPSLMGAQTSARTEKAPLAFPEIRTRPDGAESVAELRTEPREKVRVGIIGANTARLNVLRNVPFVEIVATCGSENIWRRERETLCTREDMEVVYISGTPSEMVQLALVGMRTGKHVFIEPPGALSVRECWDLVDTSELTRRHCVMLEKTCFGDEELFVLNMAKSGVFGELNRAECIYETDENPGSGNMLSGCGLGPVARVFDLNRSDKPKRLVAMETASQPGKRERDSILIKTERGRMIVLHRNLISPRLHSRIQNLSGTDGAFFGFPSRITLKSPGKYEIIGDARDAWLNHRGYAKLFRRFRHPLWKTVGIDAAQRGCGGADFLMNFRLLDCIRRGETPDITVYDVALWSSINALASYSIANDSVPVLVPDFTRRKL